MIAEKISHLTAGPIITIYDVPRVYYWRSHQLQQNVVAEIISANIDHAEPIWNRTNIIAKFMSLTDDIVRCPELKDRIIKFSQYCEMQKVTHNIDTPLLKSPGRKFSNAAQFVSTSKSPLYKKNLTKAILKVENQTNLFTYFKIRILHFSSFFRQFLLTCH